MFHRCSFLNIDRCKGGTQNEYLHILFFYNASVNSTCAQPPPPPLRATAGHLLALSVPGVGHLQILPCPAGGRAFANPRAIPELLTLTGFLSEYNYTEGFIVKAVWLICQGHE